VAWAIRPLEEPLTDNLRIPTFQDVLLARRQIAPYLNPTPFFSYPAVNQLIGTSTYIKHENAQPTGAFKVRGGINLTSLMSEEERRRGVAAASTGNHGQSVAYAAQLFGVKARIVVPEGANPGKVAAMEGMGAEVIFHGEKFDDSVRYVTQLAEEQGLRYIHAGNEPLLIAGVGTYTLEMLETEPEIDVIFVPVGSGTGAAGTALTAHALHPAVKVIGVQSELSPAGYESWKARSLLSAENLTFAEGVATGKGTDLPQRILWEQLDDFVLVSDEEIQQGMIWMIQHAHTLAEGAGAAALAAAYKMRGQLQGKKVAVICSGGNSSLAHLRTALESVGQA
jgi:threonine dehydratase